MKLFGILGRDKPMAFEAFRDHVRLSLRRAKPGSLVENTANGIKLNIDGKAMQCDLRNLYRTYVKSPGERDAIVGEWIESLTTEAPEQGWSDARLTLRPLLKPNEFVQIARNEMRKSKHPDYLPAMPFAGDISVIVAREIGRNLFGVTLNALQDWGVSIETAMLEAINNMNMMSFPAVTNELTIGGAGKKNAAPGETVGLVFEADHLTATWIVLERFRDHVSMRLQGDYVVGIPNRNRLTAVRIDEPGLISSLVASNRASSRLPYPLTTQLFRVSMAATGGIVDVYRGGEDGAESLKADSLFASGRSGTSLPNMVDDAKAASYSKPLPVDLSTWGGLKESTDEPSDDASSKRGS